jgi:curved DNA-binding protein CbpA
MNLQECYRLLNVNEKASNEDLSKSFKRLAMKYHPDKNRERVEWATRAMANINIAYRTIMSHRFEDPADISAEEHGREETPPTAGERRQKKHGTVRKEEPDIASDREILINRFIRLREISKDALYRYFQYGLYNMIRRDDIPNKRKFDDVVLSLRKCYHSIKRLASHTSDTELLEHFNTFSDMIFNFYKASECWNVLDSYSNTIDVEAYRLYRKGDDALHSSHMEIFYERHNRGILKKDFAGAYLLKAEHHFNDTLARFADSTWAVETRIKLDYTLSLKKYISLFFND